MLSEHFLRGVNRFIIGFSKKVLLANVLANITQETFAASGSSMSVSYAWLGSVCYTLQLFFDFSGYSDMAIGISQMFGYNCPENFCYPYITTSVSGFWRRWHITLGAWFRDYIYIPLGGSRVKSKGRLLFNLLVVWILTGLWYGASWNFVIWGLAYFIVIAFEKISGWPSKLKYNISKWIYRICVLLFINFQWVIFRADGFRAGLKYIYHMFFSPPNSLADARALFLLKDNFVFIVAAVIFCFPVIPCLEKTFRNGKILHAVFHVGTAIVCAFLFIWAISFVVSGQNNPFLYANF